jgi:hypothetical protein
VIFGDCGEKQIPTSNVSEATFEKNGITFGERATALKKIKAQS